MVVFTLVSILKGVTALRATSERRGSGEWNSCDSVSLSPVGLTGGVGWRQLTVAYLLSPEWRDRVHTACAVYWRVAARRPGARPLCRRRRPRPSRGRLRRCRSAARPPRLLQASPP